jgi:hypothetical protein
MSRIVEQILSLLTILSQLTGTESLCIPFGLRATKNAGQWVFSLVYDDIYLVYRTSSSLEAILPRKQRRELLHRLQRRVHRLNTRSEEHKRIISKAVEKAKLQKEDFLPGIIAGIQTGNTLADLINKYLAIIHFEIVVQTLSYSGRFIAIRNPHPRVDWECTDDDFHWPIGQLALCPDIPPNEEILNVVSTIWRYVNGNSAYCMGDLITYQQQNPLPSTIVINKFDYLEPFQCKPGCHCDDCHALIARCRNCLDDGCPDCD